ncbi:MAG: acyl-CoA dehydrogenase family protein [Acidimicrobiales bacterium]|nr:acyl-CoA dehydrogenase family protein [Acidimicrobiales bacterium]MDP6298422.1 acyl-CoA dehydrogenase family protein [Acidimicrobiales bacterium]HJM27547.1 acyl-CoA dehydrogenase family protein [Acidimicrobiales bacterium]HJM98207.1 acyl-CoA dehydrogenase family protein [Acidimicrobiales bacterium]
MALSDQELQERVEALLEEVDPHASDQFTFRGAQYDAGLAFVHFPEGKGGLGLGRAKQAIVDQVLRDAKVPYHDLMVNPIGIGMGAPVILNHGTDEMHDKHLKKIFTGEDIWCQLFSEPTHGSDVAGIPSRAIKDGDEWIVNGQKVWTTLAHLSNFGMLLTRTNPEAPKHKGLSYFILDMHAAGVDVRPLYQITGEAEFNEVFLTDVRVPDDQRLGDEGDGWRVAITTLMNERVALGGGSGGKGGGPIRTLMNIWESKKDDLSKVERKIFRDRVAELWGRAEILRLTNQRAKALAKSGDAGPGGSIGKLFSAELNLEIYELCINLEGADGMLHPNGYPMIRSDEAYNAGSISGQFLRSRANTIEGGTSEIMRNILGERVLGLPGDVRVDKEVPWSEIPR